MLQDIHRFKIPYRKKLNHRGRRARRDKIGKRLKAQRAREQAVPFPTLPKMPTLLRGFQKRNSAVSASSSVTLFSSSGQDPEKKTLIPQRRKEPQIAEVREDAERRKFP
jgi:hypothetical protein